MLTHKNIREEAFESCIAGLPPVVGDYLRLRKFCEQPASTKHHGNYAGGLVDHSIAVAMALEEFTEKMGLTWQRPESPIIVGIFHDLCKLDSYKPDPHTEGKFTYNMNQILPVGGHGTKSIIIAQEILQGTQLRGLTEEEILCIRFHMGAYETDDWDNFDKAIRKYPNVMWTHHADMYASKVLDI